MTWLAGADVGPTRSMAARTDAGIEPRWTGMCSAWTSSSPSAVNRAAEQSARSLMFGLNAARRSTAPISSAMPGQAGQQDGEGGRAEAASVWLTVDAVRRST